MNHDYAHCLDYKKGKCPKKCIRAKLTEDLKDHVSEGFMVTWVNFKGTQYCEVGRKDG